MYETDNWHSDAVRETEKLVQGSQGSQGYCFECHFQYIEEQKNNKCVLGPLGPPMAQGPQGPQEAPGHLTDTKYIQRPFDTIIQRPSDSQEVIQQLSDT
jgi:hypothetical protein